MSSKLRPFLATKAASFSATFRTSASSGGGTGPSSTGSTAQAPRSEGGGLQHCQVHHHHHQQEPCLGHLAGPPLARCAQHSRRACLPRCTGALSSFSLPFPSRGGFRNLARSGAACPRAPPRRRRRGRRRRGAPGGRPRPPARPSPAPRAAGRRPARRTPRSWPPPPRRPGALLSAPRSPRSPRLPRSPAGAATRPGWRAMAARARNLSGFRLFF